MDNDDNSKESTSVTVKNEILLIDKNDTEHMDAVDIKQTVEPISETSED